MAEPDPSNVAPWYLRNINQALALDEASGNVYLRTGFEGNIIISGNVNIPGNVDAHISEIGTSGNLTVPWMPVSIDGNSNVTIRGGNVNAAVTGTVAVSSVTGNIAGITSNVTVVDGGGSLTVDGNVGITGNVNIGTMPAITGNVNANITGGNVTATISSPVTTYIGGTNLDAFARLRVSNPLTVFDSALTGYRKFEFSSATTTGGNVTWDFNANVRKLSVTTSSGSEVIRESYKVFPYQPGKSLLIMNSFLMAPAQANLRQRVGFFGSQNGIYFEQTNTTKNMVIRSYSTGVLTEERVAQSSWNGDRLTGAGGATNPSGITLNTSAGQIMWCDVEWLGAGDVRCGFIIDGQFIVCHTFHHANDPAFTTTYMGSATLPIRFEITNTGATASASTFQQICTTVISEGGYNPVKSVYSAGTGINTKRLATAGTYYPIVSLRLNSSYLNSVVSLAQVDVLSPTVNYYRWAIVKNATLTGATWAATSPSARIDVDTAATAVTGGTEIQSGYASSRENAFVAAQQFADQLGRSLQGVSDTWTLVMTATSNNADVLAQVGWQEIA